jgi:hypothetical protein
VFLTLPTCCLEACSRIIELELEPVDAASTNFESVRSRIMVDALGVYDAASTFLSDPRIDDWWLGQPFVPADLLAMFSVVNWATMVVLKPSHAGKLRLG